VPGTDEVSSEPDDPKFGPVGKQVIEDTGALDTKRMETIDDETTGACVDYGTAICTIDHAVKALQKFLAKD
jgi:hypothetical protein